VAATSFAIDNQRPRLSRARIILPTEHGSWSFLFEPLIVGFAVAFSAAAPWVLLASVSLFFTRQPLKVFLQARSHPPTSNAALRPLALFLALGLGGVSGMAYFGGAEIFYPAVIAVPLALLQAYLDLSRKGRSLWAEMTGAVAISATAAMIGIAGGLGWRISLAMWFILAVRFIPSILYVRNRLQLEKGKTHEPVGPVAAHFAALAVVIVLWYLGVASILTGAVFAFLLFRSAVGLSPYRTKMKAMKIGIWEVVYGAVTVLSMIVGYYAGL
jgi:hypothetical protein